MKGNAYLIGTAALAARHSEPPEDDEAEEQSASEVAELADRVVAEARAADDGQPALRPFEGDLPPPTPVRTRLLPSPLTGVGDEEWTDFVLVMRTQEPGAVSASNEMGMFAMKPRRLADFGLMRGIRKVRVPTGAMAWVGDWVPPVSQEKFLANPKLQYRVFVASMQEYMRALRDGEIELPGNSAQMTVSGALAVLHKCGPGGLKKWSEAGERFPSTIALFERSNGIF